jgi:hypothetical protein
MFLLVCVLLGVGCTDNSIENNPHYPNPAISEKTTIPVPPLIIEQYQDLACPVGARIPNSVTSGNPITYKSQGSDPDTSQIRVWLFGPKTAMKFPLNINHSDPHNLTIQREITHQLHNGTYHLLFEYPDMYGRSDLALNNSKKPDWITNRNGDLVVDLSVVRNGGLKGEDAANVIEKAIAATGGKQLVERTTMNVSEAFVHINPVADHVIGDKFWINGTTNIAEGDIIAFQVYPAIRKISEKRNQSEFGLGYFEIKVTHGECGINSWHAYYDTTWSKNETMMITATSMIQNAAEVRKFNITDSTNSLNN